MLKELLLMSQVLVMPNVEVTRDTLYISQDIQRVVDTPIVITSASRSPKRQARLMISNYHNGANLIQSYGSKIRPLLPLLKRRDLEGLTQYLQDHREFSAHMTGRAVDIRSRTLSKSDKDKIKTLTRHGRYDIIEEYNPPHIHIELVGDTLTYTETMEDLVQW